MRRENQLDLAAMMIRGLLLLLSISQAVSLFEDQVTFVLTVSSVEWSFPLLFISCVSTPCIVVGTQIQSLWLTEPTLLPDTGLYIWTRTYTADGCIRQAGLNDFHLENIGQVKGAIFSTDSKTKRIFVYTVLHNYQLFPPCDVRPLVKKVTRI